MNNNQPFTKKLEYRPEIDGLRAVAVLPVILFHAGFDFVSGGFVGVDIFFVISGYLITTIITQDLNADKFSLSYFYERRIRRILPVLFVVMFVTTLMALVFLIPRDMKDFSQSVIATTLFSSNILFFTESGYFDTSAELKPLLHTWSLAVEEQFYLFFPLILMALWRTAKYTPMLVGLGLASLVGAHVSVLISPESAFYLLHARFWELLVGAGAAQYLRSEPKPLKAIYSNMLSLFGFALVLIPIFAFSKATVFPGLSALVPTIGAVLIIVYAQKDTVIYRLLSCKALVFVGLVSYSAYLWHQPLLAFARYQTQATLPLFLSLSLCGLTLVLSYFSWKYIEQPFRNKAFLTRKQVFNLAAVVGMAFIIFGVLGQISNGFEIRYKNAENIQLEMPMRFDEQQARCFGRADNFCGESMVGKSKTDIFIVGDSIMHPLSYALNKKVPEGVNVIDMTSAGCMIFKNAQLYKADIAQKKCSPKKFSTLLNMVKKSKNPIIVYGGMLPKVISGKLYQHGSTLTHKDQMTGTDEWHGAYKTQDDQSFDIISGLKETVDELYKTNAKMILLYPFPEFGRDVGATYQKHSRYKKPEELITITMSTYKARSAMSHNALDSIKGDEIMRVYPHTIFCNDSRCSAISDDKNLVTDYVHMTDFAAGVLAEIILNKID